MWSSSGLHIRSFVIHSFINNITSISKLSELIMFADDTNLFFKHANISELFVNVNNELQKISKWFKLYKLLLNIKTNNFMFNNKNKIINTESLNVLIEYCY